MASTDLDDLVGQTILTTTPFPAAVVNQQHQLIRANEAFVQAFGPWAGERCHTLLKGESAPCEGCLSSRAYEDGACHEADPTGSHLEHAVPLQSEGGGVEAVLLLALDRHREQDLERQLKQTERLATVGLTTAGLAHSIKNILGGLEGGVYVVSSGLDQQELQRVRAGWEMVQAYIEQVKTMVQNLLRYAKAVEPSREMVCPNDLMDDVIRLFESKAALLNIELLCCKELELKPISLERDAIHACLTNLVSNAMDACTWDPDSDKQHSISVSSRERAGGGVAFEVIDNGMGIPEENQKKVLASFFTSKGIRGTGLGLLLTKKAVEEHGGQVSFTSTPGEGTSFRIELPARRTE